ncbi:BatA domain-containing protein [Aurantivibrio plasticivorans]
MSFLAPIFLAGLLAIIIPVAIHFIRRDKPQEVPFSSLRFFQTAHKKHFLIQQIQQWLLLAMRALAIALLMFAFARPFLSQTFSGFVDLAPRSVVILADHSMSMAYGNNLDEARGAISDILADLAPGDEITLVTFADDVLRIVGPTTDAETIRAAVSAMDTASDRSTRFFPAVNLASDLLRGGRFEDKSVYLISDFQKTAMQGFDEAWKLDPGVNFFPIAIGIEKTTNVAVTGVKAPSAVRTASDEVAEQIFYVRLRNLGNVVQSNQSVEFYLNGELQQSKDVDFIEQSEKVVEFSTALMQQGSQVAELRLKNSSLTNESFSADDQFYFSFDVLPKIPILVINGEASRNWYDDEGHWFSLAVAGDSESPFSVTMASPRQLNDTELAKHQVAVLLNVGQLESSQLRALTNFVEQGGSLLIAPGDRVQAAEFNRQLSSISPATLIQSQYASSNDYWLIADVEIRHPILRPLSIDWQARFDAHWVMKPAPDAEVLMSLDNSNPVLVERTIGKGRTLLFASSLDLEWNNLPLQGMYLPFIHEMLKHLSNSAERALSYRIGDTLSLPTGITSLNAPDGKSLDLVDADQPLQDVVLDQRGIYRATLSTPNGEYDIAYAVNAPIDESDLQTMDPGVLFDSVLNPETKPTQSAEVRSALMKQDIEKPQRIWWYLLLVVFVLLIAEAFQANRTYR